MVPASATAQPIVAPAASPAATAAPAAADAAMAPESTATVVPAPPHSAASASAAARSVAARAAASPTYSWAYVPFLHTLLHTGEAAVEMRQLGGAAIAAGLGEELAALCGAYHEYMTAEAPHVLQPGHVRDASVAARPGEWPYVPAAPDRDEPADPSTQAWPLCRAAADTRRRAYCRCRRCSSRACKSWSFSSRPPSDPGRRRWRRPRRCRLLLRQRRPRRCRLLLRRPWWWVRWRQVGPLSRGWSRGLAQRVWLPVTAATSWGPCRIARWT